ncbi:MAG: AAA family ATPase [Candidatus Methylomirabilales bacterium]
MATLLRTVIVDSDQDSRANLRRIVGATASVVVGEFSSIGEAFREAPACRPDVLVVEIPSESEGKDDGKGPAAFEQLAQAVPETAILATGPSSSADLVIQVIRAGALDFLSRPVKSDELLAALDKVIRSRRAVAPERRHGRVTSVFSTKGGLGVTTVATNLAVCFAEGAPGRVLLVDLDTRQSDVATFLNLRHPYSVLDAFENVSRMDQSFLQGLLSHHPTGLCVLPGPARIERGKHSVEQVQTGLEILRSHFDHVVLDLPHDMDPGTIAALETSDEILFLVSLNVSALRSGAAGLAAFRHLGLDLRKVRIVVMREGTGEDVTLKHVRETLELPVYWKTPSDYPTVVTAINSGEPVVIASPRSKIAKNLRQLGEMLINGHVTEPPPRGTSLLRLVRIPSRWPGGK